MGSCPDTDIDPIVFCNPRTSERKCVMSALSETQPPCVFPFIFRLLSFLSFLFVSTLIHYGLSNGGHRGKA